MPRRQRRARRPRAGRPVEYTDEQILNALIEFKGMVYLAAKSLGCHATTIYERAKVVTNLDQTIKQENGQVLDIAEMKLYEGVLAGEAWAIMFALSHKGKSRGYSTKTEIEVREGKQLELIEEIIEVSDGENPTSNPPAPGPV